MATLCAEREVWKMMSPSRSGVAAPAQAGRSSATINPSGNPPRNMYPISASPPLSFAASPISRRTAMHFLLLYTYIPDILERRPQFRGAHVKYARESVARGELVLGG